MPLKRPVAGDPVVVEDFGQPVYDYIVANTPTAWVALTLQSSWTVSAGNVAQYRKHGDRVQLRGTITGGTAGSAGFATLPVGYRPPYDVQFGVTLYTTQRVPGVILIRTTGVCALYDVTSEFGLDVVEFTVA